MSFISIIVLHSRIPHLLTYFYACSYKRSQVASKSSSIKSSTHTRQFSTLVMPSILTRRHRTQTTSTSRTRWATPWPRASTSSRTTATSSIMLRSPLNDSILKRRRFFFIRIYQLALSFFPHIPRIRNNKKYNHLYSKPQWFHFAGDSEKLENFEHKCAHSGALGYSCILQFEIKDRPINWG